MEHDLGNLPTTVERQNVTVWVPGSLIDPIGHFETVEMDVLAVDLSESPTLGNGDSVSFRFTVAGT